MFTIVSCCNRFSVFCLVRRILRDIYPWNIPIFHRSQQRLWSVQICQNWNCYQTKLYTRTELRCVSVYLRIQPMFYIGLIEYVKTLQDSSHSGNPKKSLPIGGNTSAQSAYKPCYNPPPPMWRSLLSCFVGRVGLVTHYMCLEDLSPKPMHLLLGAAGLWLRACRCTGSQRHPPEDIHHLSCSPTRPPTRPTNPWKFSSEPD